MQDLLIKSGITLRDNKIVLPDWCKRVKIDIGLSENAPQSEKWLRKDSELIVFGFEPVRSNYQTIKSGTSRFPTKLNPDRIGKSFFLIETALGDVDSEMIVDFHVTNGDPGCSSILEPISYKTNRVEKVRLNSLNSFLDYFDFSKKPSVISYVKTDCQGYDIKVLNGAKKYLDKIACYTCEIDTNNYKFDDENSIQKFTEIFNKFNFELYQPKHKIFNFINKYPFIKCDDPTFINNNFKSNLFDITKKIWQVG